MEQFIQEKKKEFKQKLDTYDKDYGFIVFEEGYDNDGYDTALIEDHFEASLREAYNEGRKDEATGCYRHSREYEEKLNKELITVSEVFTKIKEIESETMKDAIQNNRIYSPTILSWAETGLKLLDNMKFNNEKKKTN